MALRRKLIGPHEKHHKRKRAERRRERIEYLVKKSVSLDHDYVNKETNGTVDESVNVTPFQPSQVSLEHNYINKIKHKIFLKGTINTVAKNVNIACDQEDQLTQVEKNQSETLKETNNAADASANIDCDQGDQSTQIKRGHSKSLKEMNNTADASANIVCDQGDQPSQETKDTTDGHVNTACDQSNHPSQVSLCSDLFVKEEKKEFLRELLSPAIFPKCWTFVKSRGSSITICQLSDNVDPEVQKTLTINTFSNIVLKVHKNIIPEYHDIWNNISLPLDGTIESVAQKIFAFINAIDSYSVCCGTSEEKLLNFYSSLPDTSPVKQQCYLESRFQEQLNDGAERTLRSNCCWFLVKNIRCRPCSKIKQRLQKMNDENEEIAREAPKPKPLQHKHIQQDEVIYCWHKRKKRVGEKKNSSRESKNETES